MKLKSIIILTFALITFLGGANCQSAALCDLCIAKLTPVMDLLLSKTFVEFIQGFLDHSACFIYDIFVPGSLIFCESLVREYTIKMY